MSLPYPTWLTRPSLSPWFAMAVTLVLAACGGGVASGSAASEPSTQSSAVASAEPAPSSEPSEAVQPTEAAEAVCLPPEVFAAVEDISNVVEPTVPADEIADAVEALDLSSFDDDALEGMQTDLVTRLRDGDTNSFDLQIAAGFLLERASLTEC